jgi:DNA-binding HxlR family transcriptional regulator
MSATSEARPNSECGSIREILDRMGDKWSLHVIGRLANGPAGFTALLRDLRGISRRMLTLTLRALERDGIVERIEYSTGLKRVEYRLTSLGMTFVEPVRGISNWVRQHQDSIEAAQRRFDRRRELGDEGRGRVVIRMGKR